VTGKAGCKIVRLFQFAYILSVVLTGGKKAMAFRKNDFCVASTKQSFTKLTVFNICIVA